jgi:hypothetical protein
LSELTYWDLVLLLVVSSHATALAYIHAPRWKAFFYALPVPFTFCSLALGQPVGTTHALGLLGSFLFVYAVRGLHISARLPIVVAIVISGLGYGLIGAGLTAVVPDTELNFWLALAGVFVLATVLHLTLRHRDEPGHRSPLPVPVKFLAVVSIIAVLILLKQWLKGFMAAFPILGTITTYEARHSLWTLCRQVPVLMIGASLMLGVCRVTQAQFDDVRTGLLAGLALGWLVYLACSILLTRRMWGQPISSE